MPEPLDQLPDEAPDQPLAGEPSQHERISRRQALRLLGFAAAVAAPLPLFESSAAALRAMAGPVQADPTMQVTHVGDHRLRRWTMVIDLRKCDGCQSVGRPPQCTAACVEGHFAPRPMEWVEVFEVGHAAGHLGAGTFFQPVPCQQCQNPPCTNVCPVGATFSTPEGTVLIDQDRCIGCRICMAACPYDRRFFNWGQPPIPAEADMAKYSPEHQVPARRGTVMKCDFCPDLARAGTLPFCATACPQHAIAYGDLEEGLVSNGVEVFDVHRFLDEQHAYRLKEDLGTEPRVYYIPGHGELVGRDPTTRGRLPTEWRWQQRAGDSTWQR
jgi:molybdopterin-containing oxidoreductase family iron-sulfur binding subunit